MRKRIIYYIIIMFVLLLALNAIGDDAGLTTDSSGSRRPIQGVFTPGTARLIVSKLNTWTRSESLTTNIVQLYSPYKFYYTHGDYTVRCDSLDHLAPATTLITMGIGNSKYLAIKGHTTADTIYVTEF